jgi:hypothetical protein
VTNYPRSAYGSSNPNAGYPANGDRAAFGGHAWPAGVPTGLLARTTYTSSKGQRNFVVMRRELVPLWNLAFEICDRKHGYTVWSNHNGENWGPWGYENRAISGTSTASGHSMGLSVDINAPFNPYSYTFQSDMPPKMVADLESLGLYWGGRYQGQKYDAMHFGFCRAPGTLGQYIAKARAILGKPAPKPPAPKPPTKVTGIPKPKKTATYNPAGRKPVWPLPAGHTLGVASGPATQHSGDPRYDSAVTRSRIKIPQSYLGAIGWYTGRIDGLFGSGMEAATKRFQKAYNGPTGKLKVDGIIGPRTWNAMGCRV